MQENTFQSLELGIIQIRQHFNGKSAWQSAFTMKTLWKIKISWYILGPLPLSKLCKPVKRHKMFSLNIHQRFTDSAISTVHIHNSGVKLKPCGRYKALQSGQTTQLQPVRHYPIQGCLPWLVLWVVDVNFGQVFVDLNTDTHFNC